LLAANAVPILGVLFWGWSVGDILVLYWAENIIVGFYTLPKIVLAKGPWPLKLFLLPFFLFHFGMFTFVHGVFLVTLLQTVGFDVYSGGTLETIQSAFFALLLSHGISFILHGVIGGEAMMREANEAMGSPYPRVIVMHITILAGGFALFLIAKDIAVLGVILAALKIAVDVKAHLKAHQPYVRRG